MKKIFYIITISCVLLSVTVFGQQTKLAQTGMKFLGVSLDARSSALADAMTAVEDVSATAMFYNPAGMARLENFSSVTLGTVQWIADIKYYYTGIALRPFNGEFGVIGFTALAVDYGEFLGTIRSNNTQGYENTGIFTPKGLAFGIGYAKELSDKFSVGGNVRYVRQQLGTAVIGLDDNGVMTRKDYAKGIMAFDFGVLYKTGFKSLTFGMSVRNFSTEVKYEAEGFQLPLNFRIGLAMDLFDLTSLDKKTHSLLFSVDAIHHRDYPEQMNFGMEYNLMKLVSLRMGYSFPNDERGWNFGIGLNRGGDNTKMLIDYSYSPFGEFDPVHRITLSFSF